MTQHFRALLTESTPHESVRAALAKQETACSILLVVFS